MGCEWDVHAAYELSVPRSNISPSALICPRGNQHWTGISGSRFRPVSYFGVTGLRPLVGWGSVGRLDIAFFFWVRRCIGFASHSCTGNFSRRVLPQHGKASLPNDQTRCVCVGVFCFLFSVVTAQERRPTGMVYSRQPGQ